MSGPRILRGVLAGSVLQIAKQGLSIGWRRRNNCPSTREVYGQPIAWVIFAGRNQALHFEDETLTNDETKACLAALTSARAPADLAHIARRSLAPAILSLLGWNDYEAYLADMVALLEHGRDPARDISSGTA